MPTPAVTNWFGDLVSHPQVVVEANSTADVVAILKDPVKYPSPVRAIGSNHSTAPCGVVEGGTLIMMSKMNQIHQITSDTVTAQAGAIYIDVAQELEKKNLQFYVNTEIGNLSMGSAACSGTKDGSMPGEYGQVNSYATEVEMVLPSGDILEIDESQPELLQQVRSSYGLFGIVTAATFRVRPILPMAVYHETFTLEDFVQKLPELFARNESMMYYVFPFDNLITVEFRKYNPGASGIPNRVIWPLRNYLWGSAGPAFCRQVEAEISDRTIRYGVIDGFCAMWRFKLTNLIRADYSIATEQMIRYPVPANNSSYTFSFWAFPEASFADGVGRLFQIFPRLLPTEGISQQHAERWVSRGEGPKFTVVLFLRWQCHDGGSGLHGQSRVGSFPGCLQRTLQQSGRDSAAESDGQGHGGPGTERPGRSPQGLRQGAENL